MRPAFRAFQRASQHAKGCAAQPRSLWIKPTNQQILQEPRALAVLEVSSVRSLLQAQHHAPCLINVLGWRPRLAFHTSATRGASSIIQFPLAQTGEGIKECELTEWYVKVHSRQLPHLPPLCRKAAALTSLRRYARCRATKQLLKSPADIQESSRSSTIA